MHYLINNGVCYEAESLEEAKLLDSILMSASYEDDIVIRKGSPDGKIVATKRFIKEPQVITGKPGYYTDWI